MSDRRRAIPSIESVLSAPGMAELLQTQPRARVVAVLRSVQQEVRDNALAAPADAGWYVSRTASRLQELATASLRRVINATGVILHTNLGRAPLSDAALLAVIDTARGYSNLEYDLTNGARGSRYDHCTQLLRELTGAADALVVNNNAAALVLALNTFARDRLAIVSRGELVEIGGSFRVPEILERSGARLREVGSTNRTHLRDYADAVDDQSKVLLKVHRSNFEMTGFVSEVDVRELAELARDRDCILIHDLGSGLIADLTNAGLFGEPPAAEIVHAADDAVITMSGDKLLGGPQAGILLGPAKYIAAMRSNPLCRALRVDKLTIAALEATLRAYAQGTALEEVPVLRMLHVRVDAIRSRAHAIRERLTRAGLRVAIQPGTSAVGGGAFPRAALPTELFVVEPETGVTVAEQRLRAATPPVVARVQDNRLVFDLRTVNAEDDDILVDAIVSAARA